MNELVLFIDNVSIWRLIAITWSVVLPVGAILALCLAAIRGGKVG